MIYILIFILFVFISFLEDIKMKKIYKKIFFIVGIIIFLFISAFRYKTGMDWYNYLFEYNNLNIANKIYSSYGYLFLERIGNFLKIDYFIFQAAICLFGGSIVIYFYTKNSKYTFSSIVFYYLTCYLTCNMALQKQILAITFSLIAFNSLKKSKVKFYIYILIAILFHFSAVVFFLGTLSIYFLKKINYKILVNLSFVFMIICLKVDIVKTIFNLILYLKIPILSQRIQAYTSIDYYSRNINPSMIFTLYIVLEFLLIFYVIKLKNPKDEHEFNIVIYTLFYLLLKILSLRMYILYRFTFYFNIFYCIFLTNFLSCIKFSSIRIVVKVLLFLFIGASFFSVMLTKTERRHKQYNPYYSIFNKTDSLERVKAELGERFIEE